MGNQANFCNGAAGTIAPSVFVVFDTTNNKAVNQASGTAAFIVGVSQEYSKYAPIPNATTYAADTFGDPIMVYQDTDECWLNATSAGWTAGDRLTSNASGFGVTASGAQYYGGVALTTAPGVGLYQIKVLTGKSA